MERFLYKAAKSGAPSPTHATVNYMQTNTDHANHKILVTKDLGGNQEACKFPGSLNHSLCSPAPITGNDGNY